MFSQIDYNETAEREEEDRVDMTGVLGGSPKKNKKSELISGLLNCI